MRIAHTLLAILVIRSGICGDGSGAKGALKGAEKQNPPGSTQPASSLASKVDSSLFNVFGFVEDNVKVLKLTVKNGGTTKKVQYDGKEIWSSGIFGSPCSSATLYFDGDQPTLAVLVTRNSKNKQSKVYRYHDGKKWKDGNEGTHKNKLKELIDAAKKESPEAVKKEQGVPSAQQGQAQAKPVDKPVEAPSTQSAGRSSNLQSSNQNTFDLATQDSSSYRSFDVNIQGVPAKVYASTCRNIIKKVTNGKDAVWTATSKQTCLYCIAFLKDNKLSTVVVQLRNSDNKISYTLSEYDKDKWEVPGGHPVHTKVNELKPKSLTLTKFSLDISLDKESDSYTVDNSEYHGIKTRSYATKDGKAINKITDREKVIGELNEDYAGYLCELYSKGNISLLRVHTETAGYKVHLCHYMNAGNGWNMIQEDVFLNKLKEMSK